MRVRLGCSEPLLLLAGLSVGMRMWPGRRGGGCSHAGGRTKASRPMEELSKGREAVPPRWCSGTPWGTGSVAGMPRRQTTKGILISRCIEPSMLVLDIEGFDGRDRGQDTLFEKQAALFALSVSDLMMVNISIFDIGREQGGGVSLFKTIFQERSKLPPGLTNIVVVLRHYNGEIPLEILRKDVIDFLEKIWISVNEEPTNIRNYIEINVVGLPDKDSQCFQKEVTTLRKLLPNITANAKVPASSFSLSSKMLWDQIKQNKKLDLRSHMMLLATLYCQQTVGALIAQFDDKILKAQDSPQGFKEAANTLLSNIMTQYNQETEMYDAGVRDKERQNMVEKINKMFKEHSGKLLRKIQEDTSAMFQEESVRELEILQKADDVVNYDDHKVESWVEKFINSCEDLKVFDLKNFHNSCEDLRKQLTSYLVFHILSLKEERVRKTAEKQQRADKKIEALTMKLDQMTQERHRMEEDATKEAEKQQRSDKNIEVLTMKLDQMTQERHHLEECVEKAAENQLMADKKIEVLTMKLDQMTQERHRLEEDARKATENKQMANKKIEVLTMKLDLMTQERQRLEERARKAAGKQQRSDKSIEVLTMKLNQMTQERHHLEECVEKAAEKQQISDKNIEVLMMKLDQRSQERQRREVEIELEKENTATGK